MNAKRLCLVVGAIAGTLLFTQCSTPDTRIQANPEVFAKLTPEQQALVKAGQIGINFSSDAVKLALGDPDRVSVRTDADGQSTIWHYVTYEADGHYLFRGYYHIGRRGWWWGGYPYYMDYPQRTVRDRFRVMFKNDKVVSITEEITP